MSDFILNSKNLNQLFVDFQMMDFQITNHRKKIQRLSDDDFQKLLMKRHHVRQVMITLDLMDAFFDWKKQLGL